MPRPLSTRASGRLRDLSIARWQVLGALPPEPLERLEILDGEAVEVGSTAHEAGGQQLFEDLPAGALDVHPAAADEVGELLADARRAARVRAVVAHRALVAGHGRAAHRTRLGHLELALVPGPPLDERPDDLGDDVARLLEDHVVADPDVLAAHLVEVVERRAGDGRTRHLGRREVRDRRQRPGPPHVRDDVLDEALDLLGRVLVGDRPARCAADHAEARLLVEAVDLDHDPVRLVRQLVTPLAPRFGELDDALDVEPGLVVRVHREAEDLEAFEGPGLGRHADGGRIDVGGLAVRQPRPPRSAGRTTRRAAGWR